MKCTYCAPNGHQITENPDIKEQGYGCARIISRNDSTIEYEITAFQGPYSVVFTSKERWIHSVESGDYEYRHTEVEYKDILEKEIEA